MTTAPSTIDQPTIDESVVEDRPWIVIVWNDPINLMSYVTFVFQKLFGYSLEKATALMLDVPTKARRWCRAGRGRRPSSTCSGCMSTAFGPRCSTTPDGRHLPQADQARRRRPIQDPP